MSRQARTTKGRGSVSENKEGGAVGGRVEVGNDRQDKATQECICPKCKNACGDGEDAILCEICEEWSHTKCINMPASLYQTVEMKGIHWFCDRCDGKFSEILRDLVAIKNKQGELSNELQVIKLKAEEANKISGEVKERVDKMELKVESCVKSLELNRVREEVDTALVQFEQRMQKLETECRTGNGNKVTVEVERVFEQRVHTVEDRVDNMRRVFMQRIEDEKGRREREEIEKRKTSLVIHRVAEGSSDEDIARVESLLRIGLAVDASKHLVSVERIGRIKKQGSENRDSLSPKGPRPIRIQLRTLEVRNEILKRAKTLRGQSDFDEIYITPDLTVDQQRKDKELRDKLKSLREQLGREGVKIHRGKVVREGKNGDNTREVLYDPNATERKTVD